MKPKSFLHAILVSLFMMSSQSSNPAFAAISTNQNSTYQCAIAVKSKKKSRIKTRIFHFVSHAKHAFKAKRKKFRDLMEGEKPSTLAKASLFLLLGGIGLSLLASAAALASAVTSVIVSLALITSVVLAFIVLFGDENKKSRAMAKAVLWTMGVLVFITLVLIGFIYLLFYALT